MAITIYTRKLTFFGLDELWFILLIGARYGGVAANTREGSQPMHSESTGFLLNRAGDRLAVNELLLSHRASVEPRSDPVGHVIMHCGFVLIQLAHHALFVELCPSKVAPLAALAAFHQVKETKAECVVLGYRGDSWRRSQYEIFLRTNESLVRIDRIARSASKRAAAELQAGYVGSRARKIRGLAGATPARL